jgi:hypothetical protein
MHFSVISMHGLGSFDLCDGSGGRLETGDIAELFLPGEAEKISGDDRLNALPPSIHLLLHTGTSPQSNPQQIIHAYVTRSYKMTRNAYVNGGVRGGLYPRAD